MDLSLNVLRLASALAAHATARQQVLAENVAHADTPGYRARDIADFASILDNAPAFAARTTRPGHIPFGADPRIPPRTVVREGRDTAGPLIHRIVRRIDAGSPRFVVQEDRPCAYPSV